MVSSGKITMHMEETKQPSNLSIPIAIVAAGALVAAAVYFGGGAGGQSTTAVPGTEVTKDVPAVTADDHIIGNTNASVTLVEYTDLECPFCKQFHTTMKRIMDEYGPEGKVAWVLRNFPLSQLHPNAPALSVAAECVAQAEGNGVYWDFVDELFARAPINTLFDMEMLDDAVSAVGADVSVFRTCYDAEETKPRVEADYNAAIESGGRGTPFNVLVLSKKISGAQKQKLEAAQKQYPGALSLSESGMSIGIAGAQPYEVVKTAIDAVLQ
jgi:protein-disulfide isomerase